MTHIQKENFVIASKETGLVSNKLIDLKNRFYSIIDKFLQFPHSLRHDFMQQGKVS